MMIAVDINGTVAQGDLAAVADTHSGTCPWDVDMPTGCSKVELELSEQQVNMLTPEVSLVTINEMNDESCRWQNCQSMMMH